MTMFRGGRSVPEWNVTDAPEGRYTRRTDIVSGNPNLYLDVEDAWLYQIDNLPVTIEIIYLDQGTGSWSLHYDAAAAPDKWAATVHKTNSGEWRTLTFPLVDAYFGNRLSGGGDHPGSDFYVHSSGEDTYFHRLRVLRYDISPTPTSVPLPTLTPSPTPDTPEPMVTPTRLLLREGVGGYDGVEDTWIGGYCNRADEEPDDGVVPHGDQDRLSLRSSDEVDVCNALIKFDLRQVPSDAHILSAKLIFKTIDDGNGSRTYFNTYDLYKSWLESEATWYNARAGVAWDVAGADGANDHPELPLDVSVLTGPVGSSAWASAYITPLVQRWVQDPDTNYGVLLRSHGRRVGYELASSEHAEIGWRPVLEIYYYPDGSLPPTTTPSPTPVPTHTPTITPSPTLTPTFMPTATPTKPFVTVTPTPTSLTGSSYNHWLPLFLVER
jgi:hypothetical protein